MSSVPHVSSLVRSCNFQLRRIGRIRKFLTQDCCEKLIHAFITSRLDNGNCLLYGLPDYQIQRLQRVHNTAARILTLTRKYDHITPILRDLHWLPISQRIKYKIVLLTYRCLNGLAPAYLSDLLVPHLPSCTLRTSDTNLLIIPKSRRKTFGDRAFACCAPRLWNNLPRHIRLSDSLSQLKTSLKSHLFQEAYGRNWTFLDTCAV